MADDAPSWDEIVSSNQTATPAPAQAQDDAAPSWAEITGGQGVPDSSTDAAPSWAEITGQGREQSQPVSAEGHLAADTREIAHATVPALGGYVAAGYGARYGAAAGALAAPVTGALSIPIGAALGAIVGFVGGGLTLSEIQERALKYFSGGDADAAQRQANAKERPIETMTAGMLPGLAGMSMGTGIKVWQRLISAGALTSLEGVQELMTDGHLDPVKLVVNAAAGAAFPTPNKLGEKLLGIGAGRTSLETGRQVTPPPDPNKPPPAEGFDPVTGDSLEEFNASGTPLAEAAGPGTGSQDAGLGGSAKVYPKEDTAPAENAGVTTGDVRPDVAAAIKATEPEELPLKTGLEEAAAGAPMPGPRVTPRVTPRVRRVADEIAEDSKQPGIMSPQEAEPEEGHLPAVGGHNPHQVLPGAEMTISPTAPKPTLDSHVAERELNKRFAKEAEPNLDDMLGTGWRDKANPADNYETQAGKALEDKLAAQKPTLPERTAAVREDVHPTPSDAQIEAENFNKGHPGRFAGKAVSIETAKGGIRRSKPGQPPWEVEMPTDYGHLLGTKGADGDPLDISVVGTGDKHFVIDQRNLETGKFDEHKIMSHAKDEADAIDHYVRGFSDGKGQDRVMAITPATEDEIRLWSNRLLNMPFKRKQPYAPADAQRHIDKLREASPAAAVERQLAEPEQRVGPDIYKPVPQAKPEITATVTENVAKATEEPHPGGVLAHDRVAVRDMIKDLRAKGGEDAAKADAIEAMSHSELMQYLEQNPIRRRNYGVKGKAGWAVADLIGPDGTPVTAGKPALAKERGQAISAVKQAFNEHPPAANESNGDLLERLRRGVGRANELNGGKEATKAYRPEYAGNRIEWTWADEARKTLAKPTPGMIKKFQDAERFLRGSRESALDYLETRRIKADSELGKGRGGDEAIDKAAQQHATADRVNVEDQMAEYLDAKRPPLKADIPEEEPEAWVKPKSVKGPADLHGPKNKQIDMTTNEGREQLAKILEDKPLLKKDLTPEERATALKRLDDAKAAGKLRTPELSPEAKAAALESLNRAMGKSKTAADAMADTLTDFSKNERASFDLNKVIADLKNSVKSFSKVHEADSYISKSSTGPADDYARSIDEALHAGRQQAKNDVIDGLHWVEESGKHGVTNELAEKFYFAKEAGKLNTLTPEEQKIYNDYVKRMADEGDHYYQEGKKLDPSRYGADSGPDYVSRILLNGKPNYDVFGKSGISDDPVEGRLNALGTGKKGQAEDRAFFALERSDGRRFVISPNKNGYTLWDKYKGYRVIEPTFKFKDGDPYVVGKDSYVMRQARTKEIEDNGRLKGGTIPRYNHDIRLSLMASNVLMKSMYRDIKQVMDLRNSDEFKKYATESSKVAEERSERSNSMKANGERYEKTILPNFQNWYVHPDLRAVMDNYAQPGFQGWDGARAISQAVTKTMFWLPVAHINNVGAHWVVERGWDWVNPMAYRRLLPTAMRAIISVVKQDHIQDVLRREGAGTIYGGVVTKDWQAKVAKMVGQDMERNPAKWDPIAKTLGWGPSTLIKSWYDASQRAMWSVNDMFITQAYLEKMLTGHSMTGAIRTVERHIPNYRLPGKVIGSGWKGRYMGQLVAEPTIISFGRYHYEVFNSFAHIVKDLAQGDAKQKFDALGNIMAMGILGLGIYPLLDAAYKKITGNPYASAHRRGPMAVGSLIHEGIEGEKDPAAAPRAAMTISPFAQALLEARSNKDFAGRNIISPGDVRLAAHGHPKAAGRVGVDAAEYMARSLISPYGTFANAYMTKNQGPLGTLRDQGLDIKNPSPKAAKYQLGAPKKALQDSTSRFRQGGRGPLEHLFNKLGFD